MHKQVYSAPGVGDESCGTLVNACAKTQQKALDLFLVRYTIDHKVHSMLCKYVEYRSKNWFPFVTPRAVM